MNSKIIKILFIVCFFTLIQKTNCIYKAPTVFYSQVFHVGTIMEGSSGTYTVTTAIPQQDIIRTGLVLFSHTKRGGFYSKFEASVVAQGSTTSSFDVTFLIILPTSRWIKLGFLIVIIKAQTTQKYIDLIGFSKFQFNLGWGPGTAIDTNTASVRTAPQTASLSANTIFTSSTGLQIAAFTTAYKMMPPFVSGSEDDTVLMEFELTASFSGTNVQTILKAGSKTKIQGFQAIVVIMNPAQVDIGVANNYYMAISFTTFSQVSGIIDLKVAAPRFGTNFNSKCIIGMNHIKYTGNDRIDYYYTNSTGLFFKTFEVDTSSTVHLAEGSVLCFGNDTQCGQDATHWDTVINDCFISTQCPLPIPDAWTLPNLCPICTQIICKNCTVDDRSICLQCDQNSTLSGGTCSCKANFFPVNMTISTSALGLWNGVSQSLHKCFQYCSVTLPNCIFDQCTNQTFCTQCQLNYYLVLTSTVTQQCFNCTQLFPNCFTCAAGSPPPACSDCILFYGVTPSGQCQTCNTLIGVGCVTCQVFSTCLSCDNLYGLYAGICYLCSSEISKCLTCSFNTVGNPLCASCFDGHFLASNQCKNCLSLFNYCISCSATECFECMIPYALGPDARCSRCIPGYWFQIGFCMNIPGCKNSLKLPNDTFICLACAIQLYFVYEPNLKTCVCEMGFYSNGGIGPDMKCESFCGDGIVALNFEECDDENLEINDGCDSTCKVQKDFNCTADDEPSNCVLYLNFTTFSFQYVWRVMGENKGILCFYIEPQHLALEKLDWSKLIKFNFPSTAVNPSQLLFEYDTESNELFVTVPYSQELENTYLQTHLVLDPQIVVSIPDQFYLNNKLNGINAPLIFEDETITHTYENVNTITFILVIIMFLQFYVGSYFHKMIGLETIQVFQSFYFVRMISNSPSTSLLNSMNLIQYSATGYANGEIFYGPLERVYRHLMGVMTPKFTSVEMKPFFLMNLNFFVLPAFLGTIAYAVSLVRKYQARNVFLETKQQFQKDIYRDMRRRALWIYDHFFFPNVMMFNLFSFFFTVQELSKKAELNDNYDKFKDESFLFHLIVNFLTLSIYCYEVFHSLEEYKKFRMTPEQRDKAPLSLNQKLEHDENNPDRPNYHPAYILVYLVYYLLLSLGMILSVLIREFTYSLQFTMGLSIGYFLLILVWGPYHSSTNWHNHFLKLYYATFVMFLVICYMFSKIDRLSSQLYVILIYVVMGLIGAILLIGFARIYIEKIFRKQLQKDPDLVRWNEGSQDVKQETESKGKKNLILNNPFSFENQLLEMHNNYQYQNDPKKLNLNSDNSLKIKGLSKQQKNELLGQIYEDINQKRQNIILENLIDSYKINKKLEKSLKPQKDKMSDLLRHQDKSQTPLNNKEKGHYLQKRFSLIKKQNQDELIKVKRRLRAQLENMDFIETFD